MPDPRLPNLFLIGAPKSGTTAMSRWLAGHPDIFMSEQAEVRPPCSAKEPYFHSPDMPAPWRVADMASYLDLFSTAPAGARYVGEANASYLYSRVAVPEILAVAPEARFIVMLRNPVELVTSLHNEFWKHGNDVPDFAEAWRLQEERRHGRRLPARFVSGAVFQYGPLGKLGEQMTRLYAAARRENVHCIIYVDFADDPALAYRRVLDFLGLPDDGRTEFPVLNRSVSYRSARLAQVLRTGRHPRLASFLRHGHLDGWLAGWNLKPAKRPVGRRMLHELRAYFRDDVGTLSKVVDRDLSPWLKGKNRCRVAMGRAVAKGRSRFGTSRIPPARRAGLVHDSMVSGGRTS